MTETLYLSDQQIVGRRLWWPGVSDRCAHCSPSGLLAVDPPVDVRDPGRVYCLTCGREAATERLQRSLSPLADVFGDRPRRGRPRSTVDGHRAAPCKDGCGKLVEVRNKTGYCKLCLSRQARNLKPRAEWSYKP